MNFLPQDRNISFSIQVLNVVRGGHIYTSNESLRSMGCGVIIFYNLKICLYIETTFPQ